MKFEIDISEEYEGVVVVVKAPEMNKEVTDLMTKLKTQKMTGISGRIDQKIYVLNPEEVYLFYSQTGKVYADTKDDIYEIRQTLYAVEEELVGTSFIRISKSAIVNVMRIKNIEVSFNGSLVVKFDNDHEEIISRRYVGKVKEFIGLGGKS